VPLVEPEHREEVMLVGRGHDGEIRIVDPDCLAVFVRSLDPEGKPDYYYRTRRHDQEGRVLFVHARALHGDDMDPLLRRLGDDKS
jgi:hypothetical protein